jgi:hypothetical protein
MNFETENTQTLNCGNASPASFFPLVQNGQHFSIKNNHFPYLFYCEFTKKQNFQASIIRTSQARILFIHQHLLSDKNDELREHESLRHEPLKHEYLRHARSKNRRRR